MFDRFLFHIFQLAGNHRKAVLATVVAVSVAAAAALFFVRYEGSIDIMLPPDPEITRSLNFLRDSSLSDKIIVSVALTDPAKNKKDLFLTTDQLAAALTPPLFTKVTSGFSVSDVMEEFSVLRYAPQVLNGEDLGAIGREINSSSVDAKMRTIFRQSMRPESIFLSSLSRTDPLGIKTFLFAKLRALPASMGYDVAIEDGHFISRDGRHSLLIVQTQVSMLDGQGSKTLVKAVQDQISQLPPYVSASVVGGHFHTVSNERVIKRDIKVASIITSAAFLLLFFVVFRDVRAVFVFLIPLAAVTWAVMIASGIEGRLSYLVIGLGTAIAGISTDYGLLVYTAKRNGADMAQMVKVAKLVTIDAATTVFSFAALYFSIIHGYHQLALFSILCVLICLFFSVVVLPLMVSRGPRASVSESAGDDRLRKYRSSAGPVIGLWALLTVIALIFSFTIRFESDVKKLDGSEQKILAEEQDFHTVWGGKNNQAIFVVQGKTYEEAMETNDLVYQDAVKAVGPDNFTSLALFWSSEKLRKQNCEQWDRFWREGREAKLKRLIAKTSPRYGFSDRAFEPFFAGLYDHRSAEGNPEGLIGRLQERFVVQNKEGASILSFFPDEQVRVDALKAVAQKYPGTFIVSGKAMSSAISLFTSREVKILAPIAVLFNIVLAMLFFRNWTEAFIALVPVLTGVVWLLGIMALFNIPLNVVNVIALIVMTGVVVDYGLGVTYEYRNNLRTGTVVAVTLSAITNVMGSGALLFAKHPALYSTGLAMVTCTITGYLSAVWVIPSLCSVLDKRHSSDEVKSGFDIA